MFRLIGSLKNRKKPDSLKKIDEKVDRLYKFLGDKLDLVKEEYVQIKEKSQNLKETNYKLALHHLENGNVSEALFRLRILLKFWPDHVEAIYLKAYCLAHKKQLIKSKQILENLIKKYPDHYQKKFDLLLDDVNRSINYDD